MANTTNTLNGLPIMESTVELDSFLSRSFLDLEKIDEKLFRSKTLWQRKEGRTIYGGQMIGQALVAASQDVPEIQHIHSLHSYFLEKGRTDIPVLYHVDNIRSGRTYCARSVKAVQAGVVIFMMQASFKQEEPIITVHQLSMPKVPYPDELETAMEMLERLKREENITDTHYLFGKEWYDTFPATIKFIEPEQFLLRKPYYPKRQLWFKAKSLIGEKLHQNTHKCCLGYLSDAFLLLTSLLRLAPLQNAVAVTSLDHSMWFHAPFRVDQWLLYELETDHIGDGRALCRGSIWDIDGTLVTTVAQEGVIRHKETPAKL